MPWGCVLLSSEGPQPLRCPHSLEAAGLESQIVQAERSDKSVPASVSSPQGATDQFFLCTQWHALAYPSHVAGYVSPSRFQMMLPIDTRAM